MSRIDWTLKLFIAERNGGPLLLVPSLGGLPEVALPSYPILRTSYLSPESAACEQGMANAQALLQDPHPLLLMTMPCADGPPYRSGVVFRRRASIPIDWTDGRHGKRSNAEEYLAAMSLDYYPWGNDLQQKKRGYFLTGPSDASSLWRIARVELDFAGRHLFTLSPVQLASGLPEVDFSAIENDLLRDKLKKDWSEVQRCLANNLYSSLITAAKNVAESLVVFAVGDSSSRLTLRQGLTALRRKLEAKQSCLLPFTLLDYHLMSKLQILHSDTHSDRVVTSGRLVEPEFALTVVSDLLQVLTSVRLTRRDGPAPSS